MNREPQAKKGGEEIANPNAEQWNNIDPREIISVPNDREQKKNDDAKALHEVSAGEKKESEGAERLDKLAVKFSQASIDYMAKTNAKDQFNREKAAAMSDRGFFGKIGVGIKYAFLERSKTQEYTNVQRGAIEQVITNEAQGNEDVRQGFSAEQKGSMSEQQAKDLAAAVTAVRERFAKAADVDGAARQFQLMNGEKIQKDENGNLVGEEAQLGLIAEQQEKYETKLDTITKKIALWAGGTAVGATIGGMLGDGIGKTVVGTAATVGARKAARIAGGVVGAAITGGVLGYQRGAHQANEALVAERKKSVFGEKLQRIEGESDAQYKERKEKYEALNYGGLTDARELTEKLAGLVENGEIKDSAEATSILAEAMRLRELYNNGYWVFSFGGRKDVDKEIGALYEQMAMVWEKLPEDRRPMPGEYAINNDQRVKNSRNYVKRVRKSEATKQAAIGAITAGVAGGIVADVVGGAADAMAMADTSGDLLNSLTGETNAGVVAADVWDLDGDGDYGIYEGGKLVVDDLKFTADGHLTVESEKLLADAGFDLEKTNAGEMIQGATQTMGVQEYIAQNPDMVTEMEIAGWDNSNDVGISNVYVEDVGGKEYYVMDVTSRSGNIDVNEMQFAMSASEEAQNSVFMMDIDNGQVRVPVDSVEGSLFEGQASGHGAEFVGEFGRVVDANGMAYSEVGGHGVDTLSFKDSVELSDYKITDVKSGVSYVFNAPDAVANLDSNGTEVTGAVLAGVKDGANGEIVDLRDVDPASKYDAALDAYNQAGGSEQYHLGPSLYDSEKSGVAMYQDLMRQVATSPEQAELWRTVLGLEGAGENLTEINTAADALKNSANYAMSMDEVLDAMGEKMDGGTINVVDLSENHYTHSIYEYGTSGTLMTQDINGVDGHALELLDKNGHNILDTEQLRDIYGIPQEAQGRFLVRLDCGGQIVWVPEGEDIEFSGGGDVPEVTPTPEPEPQPEPKPEPQPEPEPEPEPIKPKNPDNLKRIVNDAPTDGNVVPLLVDEKDVTERPVYGDEIQYGAAEGMTPGSAEDHAAQEAANAASDAMDQKDA